MKISKEQRESTMPRLKEQNQAIKDNRRETILSTALKLFSVRGYDSVSVDDIAKEMNCSHGLFYHYFKDKEEVMKELIKRLNLMNKNKIVKDYSQMLAIDALKEIATYWITLLQSDSDDSYYFHLFLNIHLQKTRPAVAKQTATKLDRIELISDLVTRGQKEGDIAGGNPTEYARMFFAIFSGLSYSRMFTTAKEYITPDVNVILNLFYKKVVY